MGGYSQYHDRPNARVLDEQRVAEAEALLAAGEPFKRVLRRTRLHHSTLRKIQLGTHPIQRTVARQARCPGCGGKQKLPCRVCAARKLRPAAA